VPRGRQRRGPEHSAICHDGRNLHFSCPIRLTNPSRVAWELISRLVRLRAQDLICPLSQCVLLEPNSGKFERRFPVSYTYVYIHSLLSVISWILFGLLIANLNPSLKAFRLTTHPLPSSFATMHGVDPSSS
jgi:hypothetical protein